MFYSEEISGRLYFQNSLNDSDKSSTQLEREWCRPEESNEEHYCVVITTVNQEHCTSESVSESYNQANCVSPRSSAYPGQGTRARWLDWPDKTSVEHKE